MNRIDQLFQKKSENIMSVYFTAGYPQKGDTVEIIKKLEDAGVDMIELGIPFSDPMADGPVIQESNKKSLENGMNLSFLFEQLRDIRQITDIPILLMGYLNPAFHFGVEKFCRKCNDIGIDGVILPDLPVEVYRNHYKTHFIKNNVYNIFLVAPTTTKQRLEQILPEAEGFVYMVSSSSTTGNKNAPNNQLNYVQTIRKIRDDIPVMAGFGIHDGNMFREVCQYVNGGIIGSAFIKKLMRYDETLDTRVESFIQSMNMVR
ncbi:MAG: tryptophan synthase subunit alpha [Bacteroidota bacterium]